MKKPANRYLKNGKLCQAHGNYVKMKQPTFVPSPGQSYIHLFEKNYPFGGIQILFIGDLLQLPPVVQDEEWDYLALYYPGVHYLNPAKYKLFTAEFQNPLSVNTRVAFRVV